MKSTTILFLILLGISYVIWAGEKPEERNLSLVRSFPGPDAEIGLVMPNDLHFDEAGNVYVLDQRKSCIHRFNQVGELVMTIGKYGQGPDEFNWPNGFTVNDQRLFVIDQGNKRLQILNTEGGFLGSFKLFGSFSNMAIIRDQIYCQDYLLQDESDKAKLISIFDLQGRKTKSFGDLLNDSFGVPKLLSPVGSEIYLAHFLDKIYCLFQYYPIIRVFDLEGNLLQTFELNAYPYKEMIPGNYNLKKIMARPDYIDLKYLFLAFDVIEDGMFLVLYQDKLVIHHYDFNGKLRKAYSWNHPDQDENVYVRSMKVRKNEAGLEFYVLQSSPDTGVYVYQ